VTGSPTENAGIEVERGVSTNVLIRWNETSDAWEFTNDGTAYKTFNAAADISGTTLASNVVSSSLTSVGTIATGTWQGTAIAGQYGGTGVANTGKTITLGGNLTTSGAYALTLTLSNTTSVTLPTSGTLATLSGSESLTNKKLGSLTSNGIVATSGGDGSLSVTSTTGSGNVVLASTPSMTSPVVANSIDTTSTSFDLVNTDALTVNFAGAAANVYVGSITGTTTVNGAMVVEQSMTVNGSTVLGPSEIVVKTSSYSPLLADQGKILEMANGSDAVITVPRNDSIAFPVGSQITVIRNGAGKVSFSPASGVTLRSDSSKQYIATQYSAATLIKRDTDEWYLVGNLSAS
jgi:hypothetical protein